MAGSWPRSPKFWEKGSLKSITFEFIADADDSTVPDFVFTGEMCRFFEGCYIYLVETIAGSTGPTASTDVTLEDAAGDILGGASTIANSGRSTARPLVNSVPDSWPYDGRPLTLKIANNSVDSATAKITIFGVQS